MNRIHLLEIVFQRRAQEKEIKHEARMPAYRKRGITSWRETGLQLISFREFVEVDIPVGQGAHATETVKRVILRAVAANVEPQYEFFYVIAHFKGADETEFSRTIVPRTEITLQIRGLRH